MTRLFFFACLIVFTSCKSKTKNEIPTTGDKVPVDTVLLHDTDSATVSNQVTDQPVINNVDLVNFGFLKLGQHYKETLEYIGNPDSKSEAIEWGADGLLHEDWTWSSKGIVLNMSSEKENKDATLSIFSITATLPCNFKTKAGMHIGKSYAEVEAAYKNNIDPYSTNRNQITVGDLYEGIIFTFKNNKVVKIFLGAAAE